MAKGSNGKRCQECGAVGVSQDADLCRACQIGQEYGPEARRDYMTRLAKKGGEASKAKRGAHALKVDQLPALTDHGSVKRWLAALAEGVASGQLSKSLSGEVRNILRIWMKAHKAETTDEVVEEIRQELDQLRQKLEGRGEPWR